MRLIDADKFKQQVAAVVLTGNLSVKKGNAMCELIDKQLTAYDVDKVVEQLRKEISDCMCEDCDTYTDCDTCRAEKAVEIAKSGGIE